MEYESDRALNDPQLEEAKRKACSDFDTYFNLKGEVHDPNFAQPTYQSRIPTIPIDEAQGFWINGGKTGGKKDDQIASETFDHDLPTLPKEGVKELPPLPWDTGKISTEDAIKLVKARTDPTDEELADLLNTTVLRMYKQIESGVYSKENLIKAYKSGLRSE